MRYIKFFLVISIIFIAGLVTDFGLTGCSGGSSGSSTENPVTDISAINLQAMPGNTEVQLTWAPLEGAAQYNIYWANTSGQTANENPAIENQVSGFIHTGLTNDIPYYYTIRAVLANGDLTEFSPEAFATPSEDAVILPPGDGDGDGDPSIHTLKAPTNAAIMASVISTNPYGILSGRTINPFILPPCTRDDGSEINFPVTYSIERAPDIGEDVAEDLVGLIFNSNTREVSTAEGFVFEEAVDRPVLDIRAIYTCTDDANDELTTSITFSLTDTDQGGINDSAEFLAGLPILNNSFGWIQTTTENINLYRTSVHSRIPNGLTVPTMGMNPVNASDEEADSDFDHDGISNKDEIRDPLNNLFISPSTMSFNASKATGQSGNRPYSIASEDFNADSRIDLAVVNSTESQITIMLKNVDGTFTTSNYVIAGRPTDIVAANFDGVEGIDLAVLSKGADFEDRGFITILLGDGLGSFTPYDGADEDTDPDLFEVELNPFKMIAVDINLDDALDLIVTNEDSNNISILPGDGHGSFAGFGIVGYIDQDVGDKPLGIVAANFDDDAANTIDLAITRDGGITILIGRADGTFMRRNLVAESHPEGIITMDYNADGLLDLIVANNGSNNVSFLPNLGRGIFRDSTALEGTGYLTLDVGNRPRDIAGINLDEDGMFDALVVSNSSSNDITVINRGVEAGSFQGGTYNVGIDPFKINIADYNNDDVQDIAVANYDSNNISFLYGDGHGFFNEDYSAGYDPYNVATGDFNNDGYLDLAVLNMGNHIAGELGSVNILLGNSSNIFTSGETFAVGRIPYGITVADFNNDGNLDLAIKNEIENLVEGAPPFDGAVSIYTGNGAGHFDFNHHYPVCIGLSRMISADFNKDNFVDIAITDQIGDGVYVLVNNTATAGVLSFETSTFSEGIGERPSNLAAVDINNDLRLDLIVASSDRVTILCGIEGEGLFTNDCNADGFSEILCYRNLGDGSCDPAFVDTINVTSLWITDIDSEGTSDGDLDIFLSANMDSDGDGSYDDEGEIVIFEQLGPLQFESDSMGFAGDRVGNALISDFIITDLNGDNSKEFVVLSYDENSLFVLEQNDEGRLVDIIGRYPVGSMPVKLLGADFDNDGDIDFAIINIGNDSVSILRNQ